MALPVVFRRRVGRDLADAYGWYEERRAGLGEEFLASVGTSFDAIVNFLLAAAAKQNSLSAA